MDFMPLIPFLGVSIPESLIIYYMVLTILRKKESWLFVIALSLVTSLFSYIIRSIPIVFGIHSILQIILMIIFLNLFLKLSWRVAVVVIILTSVVLGLSEGIFVPFLAWFFSFDLQQVISDSWLRILFTLPHLLFLTALTHIFNQRQWRLPLISRLMEVNSGAVGGTERQFFSQTYLLVLCLVQILMLILLKISFYIYTSGVYPSLTLDTLVAISILVLMIAVLASIFVTSYLLKVTEREARLTTELHHIKEKHNLNLRLQVVRHDFYNHLTSIYGYLKAGHYMQAETYIQNLYTTIRHIHSLIKLDPPELAALLSVKQEEAKARGVDFHWEVNIEGSNLPLSPEELTHLVCNLLDNAMEAAKADCFPKVELTIVSSMMGLDLKVSNNGKPITQDVRNNIFTPGYTTKNKNQHSGLGLYIIKQITDRHNGHLELKEPENYPGVEFKLCIPWNN
ncbi:sensor histidine kinase [Cellulosilyticum sp. I15G10I2]|uniref:sensor histidine kinase n=1 Tax=Cellulosilyticum sp. I15G10I2 TaxID=1892843 RepID=UPI00085BAFA4|nr:ATP-binding protein [Cellulosilyticum sp. I15G10I2]